MLGKCADAKEIYLEGYIGIILENNISKRNF